MKIILKIFIVIYAGLFVFCSTNKEGEVNIQSSDVLVKKDMNLKRMREFITNNNKIYLLDAGSYLDTIYFQDENKYFFNYNEPFTMLKNGCFVICSRKEPAVYLYDNKGNFLRQISRSGRGPGEYKMIDGIDSDDKYIYVAEGIERKILCYDYNGNYISQTLSARKEAPYAFKVSPSSDKYYYYHIFPNYKNDNSYMITMGSIKNGILKQFGKMNKINKIASSSGDINGIVLNEKGYLFVIKPEEYGYEIYSKSGELISNITKNIPSYFKPVSDYKEVERVIDDPYKSYFLFIKHTKAQSIFYLGDNILAVLYVRPIISGNKREITWNDIVTASKDVNYKINIEFWHVDGKYLGTIELDDRVIFANGKDGCLYYWGFNAKKNEKGYMLNPYLVKWNLWKEIGK